MQDQQVQIHVGKNNVVFTIKNKIFVYVQIHNFCGPLNLEAWHYNEH